MGAEVRGLCAGAQSGLTLVAPFVKARTLAELLEPVGAGVAVELVTRWRPIEIANGVSDVEAFDVVHQRGGTTRILDRLHAKVFVRDDGTGLIGSANITDKAFGWNAAANLEVLTQVNGDAPEVQSMLAVIDRESVVADLSLKEEMERAALAVRETSHGRNPQPDVSSAGLSDWLPESRHPADLFTVYVDPRAASSAAVTSALRDLTKLQVPAGLDQAAFESYIRARLLVSPLHGRLKAYLSDFRRFSEVRRWLQDQYGLDRESSERTWQTLQRWLFTFLPQAYEARRVDYSEQVKYRG